MVAAVLEAPKSPFALLVLPEKVNPVILFPVRENGAAQKKTAEKITQIHTDFFDSVPLWGGTWAEFFRKFEGQLSGLTRTEVAKFNLGDNPAVYSAYFQEAVSEAVKAGLLKIVEVDNSTETKIGNHKAVAADLTEHLFLNDLSLRLKTILTADTSDLKMAIDNFSKTDFAEHAKEFGFQAVGDYASRFVKFIAAARPGKEFSMTEFYNSDAIYPDPDAGFQRYLPNFIDSVVEKAVAAGILAMQIHESSRPMFSVVKGLELFFPQTSNPLRIVS